MQPHRCAQRFAKRRKGANSSPSNLGHSRKRAKLWNGSYEHLLVSWDRIHWRSKVVSRHALNKSSSDYVGSNLGRTCRNFFWRLLLGCQKLAAWQRQEPKQSLFFGYFTWFQEMLAHGLVTDDCKERMSKSHGVLLTCIVLVSLQSYCCHHGRRGEVYCKKCHAFKNKTNKKQPSTTKKTQKNHKNTLFYFILASCIHDSPCNSAEAPSMLGDVKVKSEKTKLGSNLTEVSARCKRTS